jgi:hypothetical protein
MMKTASFTYLKNSSPLKCDRIVDWAVFDLPKGLYGLEGFCLLEGSGPCEVKRKMRA